MCRFLNGRPVGVWWEVEQHGGYLVAELEGGWAGLGGAGLHLYPDCVTAVVGEFAQSQLITGHHARVVRAEVERGVCVLRCSVYCALFIVNQTSLAQLLVQDLRPRGPGAGAGGVAAGAQLPPAAAPGPVRGQAGHGGGQRTARGRRGALRSPGAPN